MINFHTLSLKNFKAFKDLSNFTIKPITILAGTNSSGKSSIIQSLLFLKQSFENNKNATHLFNGPLTKLGTFKDVVYEKNDKKEIKIAFTTSMLIDDPSIRPILSNSTLLWYDFSYKIFFSYQMGSGGLLDKVNISYFKVQFIPLAGSITDIGFMEFFQKEDKIYNVSWQLFHRKKSFIDILREDDVIEIIRGTQENLNISFSNLRPITIEDKNVPKEINTILSYLGTFIQKTVTYSYISPHRIEPQKRYIYEDEAINIGNYGENAAYILSKFKRDITFHHFDTTLQKFKFKKTTLANALKLWLFYMGINNFEAVIKDGIIYLEMESGTSGKKVKVNLSEVGFGISQVFPILVEGLRMYPFRTLIVESPEAHLHPKMQMQLADFFISMALSEKRVLVETHSDHIVNRLVRRMIEDTERNLKDKIAIYFINPSEEGAKLELVEIDENRGIVNWPDGFFDQTANEQELIMRAGLKKRMAKRDKK